MNAKQGDSWDMTHHSPMPRPKDDDGYFEQMSKAVFLAGLNWNVIEKKWADIRRSLANFSIDAVAQFDDSDIDRLLKDEGMIRSAKKITAVIANAQAIQQVQREFGSFAKYQGSAQTFRLFGGVDRHDLPLLCGRRDAPNCAENTEDARNSYALNRVGVFGCSSFSPGWFTTAHCQAKS